MGGTLKLVHECMLLVRKRVRISILLNTMYNINNNVCHVCVLHTPLEVLIEKHHLFDLALPLKEWVEL